MPKVAMTVAAAGLLLGALTATPTAKADPMPPTPTPIIQQADCHGTTGDHGCGPGWFWRNGDRGWACYPC